MQYGKPLKIFAKINSYRVAFRLVVILSCVGLMQTAKAEWTGGIEGGTVVRDAGNANRIRLVLRNNDIPFSQYLYAEWLSTGEGGSNYAIGYNPRYWLTEKNYVFGESEFRVDEALGIDREIRLLGGVGRQIISTEQQGLFVEAGLGGRSTTRVALNSADEDTDTATGALGLARLGYFRTVADLVKLDLSVSGTRDSEEVSEATSEVGVSLRLPQGSVRLAYRSRYLKLGKADAVTDNDSFISFGYSF